ncbi:MAG TPA: DUF4238 domain-containing protein [Allosphingosinicella sp.]|jgi:hypothetical protein
MNPPRSHHYIPQFWLKRFSPTGHTLVWSYDWEEDKVKQRSVRNLMEQQDLYTQQTSSGPDYSLETKDFGDADRIGSELFRQLSHGERGAALREGMADFLAVMVLRHPTTVERHPQAAAELHLAILDALQISNTLCEFHAELIARGKGAIPVTEAEFQQMKAFPPAIRDRAIGAQFDAALSPGGNPELPFGDVIRDSSGRATISSVLLGMEWTLARTAEPSLLIGDAGILLERGESHLGWTIIVGPREALLIRPQENPVPDTIGDRTLEPWEGNAFNVETAARSRQLLIGASEAAVQAYKDIITGR